MYGIYCTEARGPCAQGLRAINAMHPEWLIHNIVFYYLDALKLLLLRIAIPFYNCVPIAIEVFIHFNVSMVMQSSTLCIKRRVERYNSSTVIHRSNGFRTST